MENHLVQPTFQFKCKKKKKKKKNVAKMFLQLIETHFPPANKLIKSLTVTLLKLVTAELKISHKLSKDIIRKLHT